jgi:SAM-dependent methyltransferase
MIPSGMSAHARRLEGYEAQLDPGTITLLEKIGVAAGWSCLQIGGRSPSLAAWLSRRVGSGGRVLAVDVETSALDELKLPNLEVRQLDIASEELPDSQFDLVHARWVLAYVRDRSAILKRLHAAVKPGGWLMVEEPDFANARSVTALLESSPAGMEPFYGRKLYPDTRPLALREVGLEGRVTIPGQPDQYILAGPITETNVADQINLLDHSTLRFPGVITFAVWGRRR